MKEKANLKRHYNTLKKKITRVKIYVHARKTIISRAYMTK